MKIFIDASLLIYLNVPMDQEEEELVYNLYKNLMRKELFTDILVMDEVIYISKKKYGISPKDTFEFFEQAVLPYVKILPVGEQEYTVLKKYVREYNLNPSDAIHLAVMSNNNINIIATEDKDFDKTHVKRIWIEDGLYENND